MLKSVLSGYHEHCQEKAIVILIIRLLKVAEYCDGDI